MKSISQIAKWLPSENCSNIEQKRLAKKLAKSLGLTERNYRKVLSRLRGKIKIVESKMCAREWDAINFEHVPSKAAKNYRKAFRKNAPELYEKYIKAVESGEKKINASTLYPYDLVRTVSGHVGAEELRTLNAQWKALPDYFDGSEDSWLVMADVSGSMMGLPMHSSIGLALYTAERSKGPFHKKYISFTSTPQFISVESDDLKQNVHDCMRRGVGYSTNLQAAIDLILVTGIKYKVPQSDMPKNLCIVTDMEFNDPSCGTATNFEVMKAKYRAAGYEMPRIVFWNVNAKTTQTPIRANDDGVVLVSGHSPAIFKSLLSGKVHTPLSLLLDTVDSERYARVVL